MVACRNSVLAISDQFPEVSKLIEHGKGGNRELMPLPKHTTVSGKKFGKPFYPPKQQADERATQGLWKR
jgi:hypothetical protein